MTTSWLLPIAYTLFVWWASTGVILYLDGLPRRTFRWTLAGASVVLGVALWGLWATSGDTSVAGAYLAFTCAVAVWGWQEVGFLLGYVTGPRRVPCPPGLDRLSRLGLAFQTILHHELATAALGLALVLGVGFGANRTGVWTYVALWAMRQSAKLNLFLGVRNLGERLLPEHLRYLESYFTRRRMNPLFPFSVVASAAAAVVVFQRAAAAEPGSGSATGWVLVGTLLALAIVEHLFMVLPLPPDALWRWGLRSRRAAAASAPSSGDRAFAATLRPASAEPSHDRPALRPR